MAITLTHQPWAGPNYREAKQRTLILGESHHGDGQRDMTKEVVERWLGGESNRNFAFFTKLAIMLTDERPNVARRREAFADISFHNYTQRVLDGPRKQPLSMDLRDAEPAFYAALDDLRPTHLVVLGKATLWSRPIGDAINPAPLVRLHDRDIAVGKIIREYGTTLVMPMNHPSGGYNGHDWHPRYRAFVSPAGS